MPGKTPMFLDQYGDPLPKLDSDDLELEGTELDELDPIGFNYGLPDHRQSWLLDDVDSQFSHEPMRSSRHHDWD